MSARLISKKSFPPTGCAIIIKLERRQLERRQVKVPDQDSNPLGPGSVKFPTFTELHDPAKLTQEQTIAHLTRASIALSYISYDHKRPSYSDDDMIILSRAAGITEQPITVGLIQTIIQSEIDADPNILFWLLTGAEWTKGAFGGCMDINADQDICVMGMVNGVCVCVKISITEYSNVIACSTPTRPTELITCYLNNTLNITQFLRTYYDRMPVTVIIDENEE